MKSPWSNVPVLRSKTKFPFVFPGKGAVTSMLNTHALVGETYSFRLLEFLNLHVTDKKYLTLTARASPLPVVTSGKSVHTSSAGS